MAVLNVTKDFDYRVNFFNPKITQINWAGSYNAIFAPGQFGEQIATDVILSGTSKIEIVWGSSPIGFSAGSWQFQNSQPFNLGVVTFNGGSGADLVFGSQIRDFFYVRGADNLSGDAGNDEFQWTLESDLVSGTRIDGGTGIDRIYMPGDGFFDFASKATLISIEQVALQNGSIDRLSDVQMQTVVRLSGGDLAETLIVSGSAINLSALDFLYWGGNNIVSLTGTDGIDTLVGSTNNDRIAGGLGRDALTGGLGDDVYVLRDAIQTSSVPLRFVYDTINENVDGGTDTIELDPVGTAPSSFSLPANVENVILGGSRAISLFGNDLANSLSGNGAANTLAGGLGSDALYGGDGVDSLQDGGADALTVRDFLYGGTGNDSYEVWNTLSSAQDVVYEGAGVSGAEGSPTDIDTINSHGEFFRDFYSTGEVLVITDDANVQFTTTYLVGGASSNTQIFGNGGSNIISTYGGSKVVDAGGGTDAISFSRYDLDASFEGVNTLVSRAGTGIDYVYDFQSGVDKVDLRSFNFGITGQQVLDQGVNVLGSDSNSSADDYVYFYLTNAGGVDNYVAFVGLTTAQLYAADFIVA